MQAGRKYTLWQIVSWLKRYIIIFIIIDAIPVILFEVVGWKWLFLPWQPISLVGIAVAFYVGFKNNSSYERLWEGRKIWGGIVNTSRSITVMFRDYVTGQFAPQPVQPEELAKEHKVLVHRHVAWMNSLTYQLREIKAWEHSNKHDDAFRRFSGIHPEGNHHGTLKAYLSEEEFAYIQNKDNKASHLLSLQSKHVRDLRSRGLLDDFRHMELGNKIAELYALQGQAERIKNFPFPRQYASANYYFVWVFIFLLPLAMIHVFAEIPIANFIWLSIPAATLVSWVFITMEMIGDYSENPFEGLYNDVPISAIARSVERDIRQMLDETDLPENLQPVGEMNILY